ncbi:DUF2849 domain-containing protein [Caulobacter sp. S45]|jgi:Protein of unknown function (DUF2849)|uniref:DUF2849 domain-containing protein n=1 Tax=Caulobacter sp. S45 TaxID=1641861 RepID=UPI00131CF093|nr:DUF2849 domain-containing protein [Caulobacter sp. S45]
MSYAAITANDLQTGDVVFWASGRWVEQFAEAELFDAAETGEAALDAAKAQATRVIDPYRIDVALEDGLPVPISYRERVRALGPTIHPDMGKQAEGGSVIKAMQSAHGAARSSGRLGLIRLKK